MENEVGIEHVAASNRLWPEKTSMAAKNVFVYADKGAGTRSVVTTIQALQRNLHSVDVKPIMASEVLQGRWKDSSVLLVMPGGADLPYCKALNGVGNQHIRGTLKQFLHSIAEHQNMVEQHSMQDASGRIRCRP